MHIASLHPFPAVPETTESRAGRLGVTEQARQDALRRIPGPGLPLAGQILVAFPTGATPPAAPR
ncbi:hypothetical protein [Teichococcus oryzae]|uniref:Uncharacterized protein n=1 Tax=Teichococcus oryzae TaxID=1608942 RepID=A0A5B2TCJ0_9PROT|nr:hypothetical protein [Pseudoroseomonas oryzae]KAA2211795.1 hypothetical protein F0Q34_18110 [Pseudoroseomonas oryzae]